MPEASRLRIFQPGRIANGRAVVGAAAGGDVSRGRSGSAPGHGGPPRGQGGGTTGHGRGGGPSGIAATIAAFAALSASSTGVPVTPPDSDAMKLLFDKTLSAQAASIGTGANGIPAGYNSLILVFVARTTQGGTLGGLDLSFNGDTNGGHYVSRRLSGDGTTPTSSQPIGNGIRFDVPATTAGANYAGVYTVWVPSYTGTTFNKTFHSTVSIETGGTNSFIEAQGGAFISTAAITQATLTPQAGNLVAGVRLSVYGTT